MATAKMAKKATAHSKRAVVKKTKCVVAKVGTPAGNNHAPGAVPAPASSGQSATGLRVRMYRVGFGDFFLLSVPTGNGPRHILIDCGVHANDLDSIKDAVAQMAADCRQQLALVIMTHRHADHISGFATCAECVQPVRRRTGLDALVRGSGTDKNAANSRRAGHGGGADEDLALAARNRPEDDELPL